ncbi:hypothetical protein M406DRAFT_321733 [Cryphonectria parasitica EP155]|uniref:Ubiquitin carrier protein n=1 Tax=Cryphonectria parasitica (strain ATCC 38755 / EP155) TaxID=660469 RepID=A0A9P5CS04_CRYP1|nr:uncharacterized protein M406DRAFT_321733 [Cryphonectria parasitica EP155]KAF3767811.1 hypothetical protein M406DRAFT_321733 [Cryphonectria parasitica EP155]
MVYEHLATLGGALVRRATDLDNNGGGSDNDDMAQLPGWAVLVFFANFLVFAPVFLYIGYTLSHVYPTLAIIEDPQPPSYAALSLNADEPTADGTHAADESSALTTTSFRRINRLLYSTAGWTSNFRGLGCAVALNFAALFCGSIFSFVLPASLGVLFAALATVQLSAAWTHIIISAPSSQHFWQRLPPFAKTFQATWLPVCAYWAAIQVTRLLPRLLSHAFGLSRWDPRNPTAVPNYSAHAVWQGFVVLVVSVACTILLVIPAQVVLCRVQASLLPPDEDTIVPFDRSFGGVVEPAVVTGKGYVDFLTAWRTFERASWIRLYRLLAKIMLVALAVYAVVMVIVVPEAILMLKTAQPADGN